MQESCVCRHVHILDNFDPDGRPGWTEVTGPSMCLGSVFSKQVYNPIGDCRPVVSIVYIFLTSFFTSFLLLLLCLLPHVNIKGSSEKYISTSNPDLPFNDI